MSPAKGNQEVIKQMLRTGLDDIYRFTLGDTYFVCI